MAARTMGLDSSTQSLTAFVLEEGAAEPLLEMSVLFDERLPTFGTTNGTLKDSDPRLVHAPPLMWAAALDLLFEEIRSTGFDLGSVEAVSGSGQQHGSVYLNERAEERLSKLDPRHTLEEQLQDIFSRKTSPIWMDSSTSAECQEIMEALGGRKRTSELTGSIAFERFTGPQIRKFYKEEPESYAATKRICLVSSYMASLLMGQVAGVDPGDGAGTNLMDIAGKKWSPEACQATAPNLLEKLEPIVPASRFVGKIHPYFVERYGFGARCKVMAWSGDNPNSLVGVGLHEQGQAAISLGTSDTFFGPMDAPRTDPRGEGHVFGSPMGTYMSLICFKNGSLAREKVRDQFDLDWDGFSEAIETSPPGNDGKLMLPYFEPEIVPRVLNPAVWRHRLSEDDVEGNVRGVVEAQMLSMRLHSQWMRVQPKRIHATGGASKNQAILRVMSDVFQAEVIAFESSNSAALGAAMRAFHGLKSSGMDKTAVSWKELADIHAVSGPAVHIQPNLETARLYDDLMARYKELEQKALSG